jgi:hypothetical protein
MKDSCSFFWVPRVQASSIFDVKYCAMEASRQTDESLGQQQAGPSSSLAWGAIRLMT